MIGSTERARAETDGTARTGLRRGTFATLGSSSRADVSARLGLAALVVLVATAGLAQAGPLQALTLLDLVVVAVPLAVVPAVRHLAPAAVSPAAATAGVAVAPLLVWSFLLDRGVGAATLAAAWLVVAVVGAVRAAALRAPPAQLAIAAYVVVAAASAVASRAGVTYAHLVEPIVQLTAVHYGFAGAGAAALALAAASHASPARATVAHAALVLVVGSAPVIALGFVTRHPLFQVGGAVTLTAGVLGTGLVTALDAVPQARRRVTGVLLRVAAVAPLVPMGLAVAWAADQHWDVPALDVPAMARTHGLVNAVGFVGCGLVGYRRLGEERAPC